jgi:hypothetical protein
VFLLSAFTGNEKFWAPTAYDIAARNLANMKKEKKEKKLKVKGKLCQIVNCDPAKYSGIHWILAITTYSDIPSVILYEPFSHDHYSRKVKAAFQQAKASVVLDTTGVQGDGWRCAYFCLLWQMLFILEQEDSIPSKPVPNGWEKLIWMLLRVKDLQAKFHSDSYQDIKISDLIQKEILSDNPDLTEILKKVRLLMVQLEEKISKPIPKKPDSVLPIEASFDSPSFGKSFRSCSTYGGGVTKKF